MRRRSPRCAACGPAAYPLDDRPGADGSLSPGATRLACPAAASWSFDAAAARLEELAGVRLDDETIRRHVHRAAGALPGRREPAPPRAAFAAAEGEAEFLTDGVMAPSRAGWRERKLAVYLKRPPGEPAEPERWADRDLPRPTAQPAYATPGDREAFAARWAERAAALGIDAAGPPAVPGDGAGWIWRAAADHVPAAQRGLDISHAAQHLATAGAALHGEGTEAAAGRAAAGRRALRAAGWPGPLDHIGATPTEGRTAAVQAGLDELIGYFAEHTGRLGHCGRLRAGRSIGSGAVEGLARRVGRRPKVPGRGWCAGNLDGMAALIATVDTPEGDGLWSRPAA